MDTVRELRRTVEDLTDDLTAQYGRSTPPCEVLHYELGLPHATLVDDSDKRLAAFRKHDDEFPEDSIKLTQEHDDLHEALQRITLDAMAKNYGAEHMCALMLAVGRRMGYQHAARMISVD